MSIEELEAAVQNQKEANIKLYKSIPVPTKDDPKNLAAEPILKEWRDGSRKLKEMIKKLNQLKDDQRASTPISTPHVSYEAREMREITSSTYLRAEKRLHKEVLNFLGVR